MPKLNSTQAGAIPPLFILIFMVSIGPFGDTEYTPSLPSIAQDLKVTYSMVQWTMTSYLIGYAISQLAYGPLSDRFGRKPIMLFGGLAFILGSIVCYASNDIYMLIAGRFMQSVGSCCGGIISNAAVRDAYPEHLRVKTYARINGAFAIAPGIGPIVGSFIDHTYGWHANFLLLIILSVLLFIGVIFFFPETNLKPQKNALSITVLWKHYKKLLTSPLFIGYSCIQGFCIGIVYASLIEAPALVVNTLHLSSNVISIIALGVTFGFILGSLFCNILVKKLKLDALILIGLCIMMFACTILFVFKSVNIISLATLLVPIIIMFTGIAFIVPNTTNAALQPFPQIVGQASALLGFFQMGIAALSTVFISLWHDGTVAALIKDYILFTFLGFVVLWLNVFIFKGSDSKAKQ